MGRSDEKAYKPTQGPRMACPRFPQQKMNHRRALSSINQNILGAVHVSHVVRKRGFPEKDVMVEKNALQPPIERPITRRFAAELTNNQQPFPKENGPTYTSLSLAAMEHSPIVEMEDCEESSSEPIPMFVKHTEAMMDEVDRMVEVEMEDVDDDPILDIDSSDCKNHLAVVEYVDDIYAHYRKTEISSRVSPHYMMRQHDINHKMRAILIDWLIEVHDKFELMEETLFLTVNIIDRFLECESVIRKKLQLVGVTALLLACKYEEVSVVSVEDLVVISDKAYTRAEVLHMEKLMVNKLQFNMSVPTPYVFMRRFLKAAQSDRKLEGLSFFIVELSLLEYEMLKYSPSMVAAAAIFTALCSLHRSKQWTKSIEWHTNYTEDQLMDCSKLMVTYHQKAGTGKLTGVYKKYSSSKLGCAVKFEPAEFLLDL